MNQIPTGTWPGFVARVATPATPAEIAACVAEGHEAVIGGEAPGGVVLAVTGQILVETGTRQDPNHDGITTEDEQAPGYWNGNAGNIRGVYGAPGWWTSFRAGEGYGPNQVILQPGPMNRFRSYVGPNEDVTDPKIRELVRRRGIDDLLRVLSWSRYSKALDAAARNDFRGYVHELHAGGYFTADETAYGNAEERLDRTIVTLPQIAAYLHGALA